MTSPSGRRWAWRFVALLVTIAVLEYSAVYVAVGVRDSWGAVRSASLPLLGVALVLQVGSWTCYSALTSTLLVAPRPRYRTVLAIDLAGNGLAHIVPGGGAAAAAARFRLLSRAGVRNEDAVSAAAVEYALTLLGLIGALAAGILTAVPGDRPHPFLKATLLMALIVLALLAGIVAVLTTRPDSTVAVTHALADRVPFLPARSLESVVRALISQLQVLGTHRPRTRRAALWTFGYWALDAASLFLSLLAFGTVVDLGALVTTYAILSLLVLLPLTPGGLGLVEGVALPLLVSFGVAAEIALLGVLAWRALQFWLPIPVGLAWWTEDADFRRIHNFACPGDVMFSDRTGLRACWPVDVSCPRPGDRVAGGAEHHAATDDGGPEG